LVIETSMFYSCVLFYKLFDITLLTNDISHFDLSVHWEFWK